MKKKLFVAIAALGALAGTPALAQEKAHELEVAPLAGAYVATGHQRDVVEDAFLVGVTASYVVAPYLGVVASFGWVPTQAKGPAKGKDLDIFQYDVGVRGRYAFDVGNGVKLEPFVGAGIGARTYSFRDLAVDSETDFASYFALGAALHYRSVSVSLNARDYVTAFDGLGVQSGSSTRNDLGLFASVGVRL